MNLKPIRTIFDLAEYYGLRIEFHDDLPANNAGFLDSADEPQFIAVNRNLPHCEHVFTIAHEMCHLISDHKRPRRKYRNRLLNGQYNNRHIKVCVRFVRKFTNRILPIEREADMFAMSWLVQRECGMVLQEFLDRHPEKTRLCTFVMADALVRLPFRIVKAIFGKLLLAQARS
jgi:Zn-dependent peptidase ImmA (M78 family)